MPRSEYQVFVEDLGTAISSFLDDAKRNAQFKAIYNKGVAASHVLNEWKYDSPELLGAAAGAAKRAIALICIRQYSLVNVELRRFIECVSWYIYFTDHRVEWDSFKANPTHSWGKRPNKPIQTAASAPINYYLRYLEERMKDEPSGLAKSAVGVFRTEYGKLSDYIHGATPAIDGSLALTFDREDPHRHSEMRARCFKIFKNGCILVAALKLSLLENLSATDRQYFDRLVSPQTARKIREQHFGLQ